MNQSLISVHLSVQQRKEDRITATPLVFHSCSTRVLDGNQTDGAPLSRAEVDVPWIMPVIFSYLGCFVMSDTLLNDTTNIYLQDDKICLHCLKVLFQTFIQYLTMGIVSGMTNPGTNPSHIGFLLKLFLGWTFILWRRWGCPTHLLSNCRWQVGGKSTGSPILLLSFSARKDREAVCFSFSKNVPLLCPGC